MLHDVLAFEVNYATTHPQIVHYTIFPFFSPLATVYKSATNWSKFFGFRKKNHDFIGGCLFVVATIVWLAEKTFFN